MKCKNFKGLKEKALFMIIHQTKEIILDLNEFKAQQKVANNSFCYFKE